MMPDYDNQFQRIDITHQVEGLSPISERSVRKKNQQKQKNQKKYQNMQKIEEEIENERQAAQDGSPGDEHIDFHA